MRLLIEHDLDWDALNDLDKIAGGVLRRQQAESGPTAGLDAIDMATENAPRIGVNIDVDRLARAHFANLDFLKVRCHPDIARHKHHQGLPGLRIVPLCRQELRDPARRRRGNSGAREIGFSLLQGRLRLLELADHELALSLEDGDLLLVYNEVRLCRTDGSLRLTEIRGGLLRILLGANALPEQILRPYTLLASKSSDLLT